MSSVEQKEASKSNVAQQNIASGYRVKIEKELNNICSNILGLLNDRLIPATTVSVPQLDAKCFVGQRESCILPQNEG